jgi:hypothetical protein
MQGVAPCLSSEGPPKWTYVQKGRSQICFLAKKKQKKVLKFLNFFQISFFYIYIILDSFDVLIFNINFLK